MTPDALHNCEYFLLEYAPQPLRDTRVPIGLFLFEASGRLVRHGFARDWKQVRCLDPHADLGLLQNLPPHFDELIRAATVSERTLSRAGNLYDQLRDMHSEQSGSLRISSPRGVLAADPEQEFERLFQEHIERPRPAAQRRPLREGSRPWIHARLSEAIDRHALSSRITRDIPVEKFTAPGDAFPIDFAYRPNGGVPDGRRARWGANGVTKYLHALSLERDWNQSKLLCYTFWRIRQETKAQMTAIVADADSNNSAVQSCRRILADADIAVQPLSLLEPYLAGVRRELRM